MDHFVHRFRLAIAHVKPVTQQNWPNSSNERFISIMVILKSSATH